VSTRGRSRMVESRLRCAVISLFGCTLFHIARAGIPLPKESQLGKMSTVMALYGKLSPAGITSDATRHAVPCAYNRPMTWDTTWGSVVTGVCTLLGALVGGKMAVRGAISAVERAVMTTEETEIRRLKVECLTNLTGLRFVITEGQSRLDEYLSRAMFEMNKIAVLWSDDPEVLKNMRDFYAERSNTRIVTLIRSMGKSTKFPLDSLSDADLTSVFLMRLTGQR
jgi:hypothetical protein